MFYNTAIHPLIFFCSSNSESRCGACPKLPGVRGVSPISLRVIQHKIPEVGNTGPQVAPEQTS